MVQAMRKHKCVVQMGTQARTSQHFQQAIDWIAEGHLGTVLVAKAWESQDKAILVNQRIVSLPTVSTMTSGSVRHLNASSIQDDFTVTGDGFLITAQVT